MRIMLCFILLVVATSAAYAQSDSLSGTNPPFKDFWHGSMLHGPQNLAARVDSDGVVIDGVKYFILIVKPDPSIDYKMLKIVPDGRGAGTMPRRFFIPPEPQPEGR